MNQNTEHFNKSDLVQIYYEQQKQIVQMVINHLHNLYNY